MVEDLCSHLLILDRGRQRYFGPMSEVRTAFADVSGDESLEEIFFRATEGDATEAGPRSSNG